MLYFFRGFLNFIKLNNKGATAIEYGLTASLIAIGTLGAMQMTGFETRKLMNCISTMIETGSEGECLADLEMQRKLVNDFFGHATGGCTGYGACLPYSGPRMTIAAFKNIALYDDDLNHFLVPENRSTFQSTIFTQVSSRVSAEVARRTPAGQPNPFAKYGTLTQAEKDLINEVATAEWRKETRN